MESSHWDVSDGEAQGDTCSYFPHKNCHLAQFVESAVLQSPNHVSHCAAWPVIIVCAPITGINGTAVLHEHVIFSYNFKLIIPLCSGECQGLNAAKIQYFHVCQLFHVHLFLFMIGVHTVRILSQPVVLMRPELATVVARWLAEPYGTLFMGERHRFTQMSTNWPIVIQCRPVGKGTPPVDW